MICRSRSSSSRTTRWGKSNGTDGFLGNPDYGIELIPIDFVAFAHACGGVGFVLDDPKHCASTMERFLGARPGASGSCCRSVEPPLPAKVKADQALKFAGLWRAASQTAAIA